MKMAFNFHKISKDSSVYKAYYRLVMLLSINIQSEHFVDRYNSSIKANDYIVCANIWQVLQTWFFILGSNAKIIFWIQGTVAEESLLKNNSKLRYYTLKLIENICLCLSNSYIYVSPYMKEFYSKKWYVKNKPSLVIPCISDLQYCQMPKEPYSFCYLGGMAKWQNFPLIVQMMDKINLKYPHSTFRIATNETIVAHEIIEKFGSSSLREKVKLCSLATKEEVEQFLSDCEFGFLIRDDILVNQVSSPIKMAEYLSCGVNIITTSAIRSYSPLLGDAGVILNSIEDIDRIDFKFNMNAALQLYEKLFSQAAVEAKVQDFISQLRG